MMLDAMRSRKSKAIKHSRSSGASRTPGRSAQHVLRKPQRNIRQIGDEHQDPEHHGIERRLDIAVTTPGLNIRKTILDYTEEDLDRVINLNVKGSALFVDGGWTGIDGPPTGLTQLAK